MLEPQKDKSAPKSENNLSTAADSSDAGTAKDKLNKSKSSGSSSKKSPSDQEHLSKGKKDKINKNGMPCIEKNDIKMSNEQISNVKDSVKTHSLDRDIFSMTPERPTSLYTPPHELPVAGNDEPGTPPPPVKRPEKISPHCSDVLSEKSDHTPPRTQTPPRPKTPVPDQSIKASNDEKRKTRKPEPKLASLYDEYEQFLLSVDTNEPSESQSNAESSPKKEDVAADEPFELSKNMQTNAPNAEENEVVESLTPPPRDFAMKISSPKHRSDSSSDSSDESEYTDSFNKVMNNNNNVLMVNLTDSSSSDESSSSSSSSSSSESSSSSSSR